MKRITALIAAAILSMTLSTTVFAEPDNSSSISTDSSAAVSSDSEGTAGQTSDEKTDTSDIQSDDEKSDTSNSQSDDEKSDTSDTQSSDETSDTSDTQSDDESTVSSDTEVSTKVENSVENQSSLTDKPKKIYTTSYAVPEAEMYIDFPNTMYVLTKNVDANSPALAACKMSRDELLKNFAETGTYIKAFAEDFTYDITVNVLKNDNTQMINNLSSLEEKDIQSIVNNVLTQPIYTGCSRSRFNNSLYLSFPIEYNQGNIKVVGMQEYTIEKGARIVITFQSYTGEMNEDFQNLISSVMNSIVFDGINPNPTSAPDNQKNSSLTNLDIRYIYLLLAALIAVISLMFIIITAMKYSKSKKKPLPVPVPADSDTSGDPPKEPVQNQEPVSVPDEPSPAETAVVTDTSDTVPPVSDTEIPSDTPSNPPDETPTEQPVSETPPSADKEPAVIPSGTQEHDDVPKADETDDGTQHLPVVDSQLELVEIAFRIIPELTPEEEDLTEIWNFIYKKFDDIEYFAAHSNRNYGNANAFYRINAGSDRTSPDTNIDSDIRDETLKTVVGDSQPEKMEFTEQPPAENPEDLNELIYATPPTYPETPETEPDETIPPVPAGDPNAKIKPMQTSEMKLGTPPKRPKNEIYKAEDTPVQNQNIKIELSKADDGSIKIGANNGTNSLNVEIEDASKPKPQE